MRNRIYIKIVRFIESVKNLYRWFPIIWKDRQWDHSYMEEILEFKLNLMYKRFSNPNCTYVSWSTKNTKRALKALKICLIIFERRQNNFYLDLWVGERDIFKMEFDNEACEQLKVCDKIEERDWKLLYKLIGEYGLYWWD